ncbi:MAG: hypothetical protein JXQ87_11715 [Bacteroidia bacterium]
MLFRSLKFSFFAAFIFTTGCKNQTEHNHQQNHAEHAEHAHEHKVVKEMTLNNGEKWKMQAELMANVENMEMAIDEYNEAALSDYAELGKSLKAETENMIKSCTMKGDSHVELHKWLEPHLGMLKDLNAAATVSEAAPIIAEIDASFELLREYFE